MIKPDPDAAPAPPAAALDDAARTRDSLATVARGGAIGLVGALVAGVGGFALIVAVANLYPITTAGTFFTATSLFLLAEALCVLGVDAGLGRFALRFEARGRGRELPALVRVAFWPPLLLSVLLGAALVLGAGPVAALLGLPSSAVTMVRLLGVALPFAVLAQLCLAGTRAFGRMRPTALTDNIGRSGSQPVLVVVAAYLGAGLTGMVAAWLLPYLAAAALAVVLFRGVMGARPHARDPEQHQGSEISSRSLAGEFWSFTWARAVTRLSQMAIQRLDILLVATLRSPAEAAIYTAATRFVPLGQLGTQAIQQVLQPRFTALLAVDDHATLHDVYRVATGWSVALAWPLYLIAATAPLVYLGFFGDEYAAQGRGVVLLLAIAMLVGVAAGPADTLLLMAGRSTWSLGNSLLALAIDVVLCLVLIPDHGVLGAGIAWATAVVVRSLLGLAQVGILLGVVSVGRPLAVAAGAAVVGVAAPLLAAGALVTLTLWWLLALAPICLALYAALLWWGRRPLELDALLAGLRRRA